MAFLVSLVARNKNEIIGLHCLGGVQSLEKSYEKDLNVLFS